MTEPQPPSSQVYVPSSQHVGDDECRALLDAVGAGLWITATPGAVPSATLLPTMWNADTLIAHASDHNEQFTSIHDEVPCRVVVQGPETYISPRWYPSIQSPHEGGAARGRAEGRAVGTWNYQQVQFAGILRVHRDADRLREEVTTLAQHHDQQRMEQGCPADAHRGPWTTAEVPDEFYAALLRGIVGLELRITEVVGRFKLSQNRTEADRAGVIDGLGTRGRDRDAAVAAAMGRATPLYTPPGTPQSEG